MASKSRAEVRRSRAAQMMQIIRMARWGAMAAWRGGAQARQGMVAVLLMHLKGAQVAGHWLLGAGALDMYWTG